MKDVNLISALLDSELRSCAKKLDISTTLIGTTKDKIALRNGDMVAAAFYGSVKMIGKAYACAGQLEPSGIIAQSHSEILWDAWNDISDDMTRVMSTDYRKLQLTLALQMLMEFATILAEGDFLAGEETHAEKEVMR